MPIVIGLIVMAVGLVSLYANRQQDERLLFLKLMGYYVLGIFYINLNGFIIPAGVVIGFLLKPYMNKKIKRGAAVFGLIMMLVGFLLR
ncbi:MAG TPA: hypothetical protein VFK44_06370 [Bacillales bacterium]|nr:hypothetical protein [Bacillales bacterium]